MRVTTRQRHYPDGRTVWTADIHVAPTGSQEPERFRVGLGTRSRASDVEAWLAGQAAGTAT